MSLTAAALYALVGVQGAAGSVRDLQSVSNQVNKTQGAMAGIGKSAGQMKTGFVQAGQGIVRIGEAIGLVAVGAVVASAKVGTSFQAMTELIHTQAGTSQDEVERMRAGIMAMVHEVGMTPQELAKGIYHIESVGLRGADALDVLRASALGAKVGLADMESVTNALTAVQYSNIKGSKNMTDAMAILDGIVGVGNMHLQDLTDSFKSGILGTGAAFGISLQSVGAAIATLTDAAVPANIAATRLNMTISHMGAPTAKALDVFKKLGIGQFQLANDMRGPNGIDAALHDIGKHLQAVGEMSAAGVLTPKGTADVTAIFGGSRFGTTAMQLLTNAMADAEHGGDRLAKKYTLITDRAKTFNDNVKATKETAGYVWGLLVADIENAGLAFSQGFLPSLARAGSRLDTFVFSHLGDMKTLGMELGKWIDKIDWTAVEHGAQSFVGIMKSVLDVISKIPPQIDLAIVGFLGLNKVSGGLLGKGLENIAGGALGIVGSVARAGLTRLPGVGSALAAVTAVHVWVDNFPLGFGLPGAGVGAGAGAAAEAGGLTLASAAGATLIGTAIAAATFAGLTALYNATATDAQKAALQGTVNDQERLKRGFGLHNAPEPGSGKSADDVALAAAIDRQNTDTRSENAGIRRATKDTADNTSTLVGKATDDLALSAQLAREQHKKDYNLSYVLAGIAKRGQAKTGHAPSKSAIEGTFGRDLLRYTRNILHSHQTAAQKLAQVERYEKLAVAGKDWGVAHKLKREIQTLEDTVQKQKLNAYLTANLNLNVDGQSLANAVVRTHQFGRTLV